MSDQKVVEITQVSQACKRCGLYHLCGPMGLDEGDIPDWLLTVKSFNDKPSKAR